MNNVKERKMDVDLMQFVICYLVIYGRMNEMKIITRNIYLIFNYNIHIEIASDQ